MTEPNKLDGQIDEIVEDAIGTGVAWIPSGKSEKWLQIGRETATKQLKTLFTEHSKEVDRLARIDELRSVLGQGQWLRPNDTYNRLKTRLTQLSKRNK